MPFMLISELIPTNWRKSKITVLLMQEIQIAKFLLFFFFFLLWNSNSFNKTEQIKIVEERQKRKSLEYAWCLSASISCVREKGKICSPLSSWAGERAKISAVESHHTERKKAGYFFSLCFGTLWIKSLALADGTSNCSLCNGFMKSYFWATHSWCSRYTTQSRGNSLNPWYVAAS